MLVKLGLNAFFLVLMLMDFILTPLVVQDEKGRYYIEYLGF